MYGLSLGVQLMDEILPCPVYALLSGLNAATFGIVWPRRIQIVLKTYIDHYLTAWLGHEAHATINPIPGDKNIFSAKRTHIPEVRK